MLFASEGDDRLLQNLFIKEYQVIVHMALVVGSRKVKN